MALMKRIEPWGKITNEKFDDVRDRMILHKAFVRNWDKDCKIDEVIDRYLKHITDVKPITARQCIKRIYPFMRTVCGR